jgi:hypothetical protein
VPATGTGLTYQQGCGCDYEDVRLEVVEKRLEVVAARLAEVAGALEAVDETVKAIRGTAGPPAARAFRK